MISKRTLWLALGSLGMIGIDPALQSQVPPVVPVQAPMPAALPLKASDTNTADVAKATANYRAMQVGFQSGVNSEADLDRAAIALAEAHLRSDAPDAPNKTLSNLNLIASQRAELFRLATVGVHAGTTSFAELKQAEAARLEANTRVSLYKAVTFQDEADLKQVVDAAAIILRNAQDLKGNGQKSLNSNDPK